MNDLIGQMLHDRYRIESLLGRKTGRRTFLATDLVAETPLVIKLLLFGRDFTWDDLKLFEREAETLKSLDHSAIPKYLDFFKIETALGKGFALVQSYIEARSLQSWVQAGRTFSEAEVKVIAQQLLSILNYLHRRQPAVVHRDIKPSNILLGDRSGNSPGQIHLVDFGSVQTAQHGGTVTIVGTYGYMPPEQFGGQTQPASDLYALGATLIYLATGQHPSELPHQEMQVLFADRVNLTPALIDWLQWLTEPSLERRLGSVSQALAALEQSLSRSGITRVKKPTGCKVQLTATRQKLEILIPSSGFSWVFMWMGVITFPIMFLGGVGFEAIASHWDWSLSCYFLVLIAMMFMWPGLCTLRGIFYSLCGRTRLCITPNRISLTHEYLGWRWLSFRILTAPRRAVTRLELTPLSYKQSFEGGTFAVPPLIHIWAGKKKFDLTSQGRLSEYDRNPVFTDVDLEWLAQELSDWLKLPVTRP